VRPAVGLLRFVRFRALGNSHFDGSIRDWPYSIRASEVSRCLVEHGGLPKPQRVSFVGLHENVFIWEAFYKDGTKIAGTLMMRVIWTARKLDICSEVGMDLNLVVTPG
jgi:hypothetical protein